MFDNLKHIKQKNILKKANLYSCYRCIYYQIQYKHRLESIHARIWIRKIPDFSIGFCRYHSLLIRDGPRRDGEHYKQKMYDGSSTTHA